MPWTDIDAALVDLDGTLVDTLGDFVAVLQCMLRDLPEPYASYTLDTQTLEPLVGKGTEDLIRKVLALAAGEEAAAESVELLFGKALQSYYQHYPRINGRFSTVYPGALEGLHAMRLRGWRLVCVTNKPTAFAQALLERKGLAHFFSHVFGGDAFERKKPDPLPLLNACAALGALPARTLMVGDSSNDAQAARAAGCPALLVTYGFNHGQPITEVPADAYTHRLDAAI